MRSATASCLKEASGPRWPTKIGEVFVATGVAAHPYHQKLYLPYGESPKNVSVVTLPVMRSRVPTIVTSWIRLKATKKAA
jgi:hypothetical protein